MVLICCPIAFVEVVGIYGGESMMGARGKRVVVVGARHRRVGIGAAVVEMGCRSGGMRGIGVLMAMVVRQPVVEIILGCRITFAVAAVVVVVIMGSLMLVLLRNVTKVVVRLEIGVSQARVYVLYVRLEARVKGHIHVVVHGGLSIGQACRAERLVGGL